MALNRFPPVGLNTPRKKQIQHIKRRCHRCSGTGRAPCQVCSGTGKVVQGKDVYGNVKFGPCAGCIGIKFTRCAACSGEGFK